MSKKTYNINPELAKDIGFELAAFHGWLSDHPGNIVEVSFSAVVKEHPCWTASKVIKMLDELAEYESVQVSDGKNNSWRTVQLNDTMLTEKKKKAEIVDPRERTTHIVTLPKEGHGPTEHAMTGSEIVVEIIKCINKINPDASRFYRWKVERDAILEMIDQGFDIGNMIYLAHLLEHTNGMPYAPVITSPREFQLKFSKLASFVMKEQAKLKAAKPNISL